MAVSNLDLRDEAFARFTLILGEARAREPNEPNAMTLATSDREGHPTARTVTLKDVSADGFVFYTNETSVKGIQMAENARACAVFFWRSLMQQVVIDGEVRVLDEQTVDAYWQTRSRESQLVAWAVEQSQPLRDRDTLLQRVAEAKTTFRDQQVPRPSHWLGYCLVPSRIEFWQAGWRRPNERISYTSSDTGWSKQYLNP